MSRVCPRMIQDCHPEEGGQRPHHSLHQVLHGRRERCRVFLVPVGAQGIYRDCRQLDHHKNGEEVVCKPYCHRTGQCKEEERVIQVDRPFRVKARFGSPCRNSTDTRDKKSPGNADKRDMGECGMPGNHGKQDKEGSKEYQSGQRPAPVAEVPWKDLRDEIDRYATHCDNKGGGSCNIIGYHKPTPRMTTVTRATRTPPNMARFQFASRFSIPMAYFPAVKRARAAATAQL